MEDQKDLAASASARVGTVLKDKWTIDRLLGVGGMATVFAATHRNQKRVAIKMLHPELSSNADVRTRFLREGYVANTVGHRGAVSVDDDDITDDGAAFLVMELLEGETLEARRLRKRGRLPPADVLSLVDQLLDVLAAAHDKGVIHRDLKPENLFFTQEGVLKVLDFGIARLRDGSGDSAGRGATRTGSVMGTPAFMAPEQARGRWELVDGQTDLWAVGATMFTLLSGHFVREAGTVNEELALAITAPAPSIATMVADLPSPVAELVDRALAYDKAARWPDARAMQIAVRLAYHALLGHEAEPEGAAAAVTGGQAPRAVMPSLVDPMPAAEPKPGETPSTITKVVGGTSLSQPAADIPAPARWSKVGVLAAVAVAVVIVVVVSRGGGQTAPSQQAAAPSSEAPVVAEPTATATAASSARAAASAAPPPSATATAVAVDKLPSATKVAPTIPKRPAEAPPPVKHDPFSRRN